MDPSLRNLPYEERLSRLKLPTFEKRRDSGDLIAVYRASKSLEKKLIEMMFVWDDRTRGHEKKLKKTTCKRDMKKYSFPYRSIEAWNKLDAKIIN